MGQKHSSLPNSALLGESRTSYESDQSVFQNRKSKTQSNQVYCWQALCCFCINVEVTEQNVNWQQQTLQLLGRSKYKKCLWKKQMQKALIQISGTYSLEYVQTNLIIDTNIIIKVFETELVTSKIFSEPDEDEEYYGDPYVILDDRKQSRISEQQFFRQVMGRITSHLREKQNPCGEMLRIFQQFVSNFDSEYSISFRESYRWSRQKQIEQESTILCDEIKGFVNFFVESLINFYMLNTQIQDQRFLNCFTEVNLSNFALTHIFSDNHLYQRVFNSFMEVFDVENRKYMENAQKLLHEPPSYFDIPQYLCLQPQDSLLEIIETQNPSVQKMSMERMQPYDEVIRILQRIERTQSPTQQLHIISLAVSEVTICINQYYDRYKYLEQQIKYGADELVPILIFVIVRSQIKDLGITLKIIETFTPKNTMKSQLGCKLVTLQNCYTHILNFDFSNQRKPLRRISSKSQAYQRINSDNQFRTKSVMEY